MMTSTFKINVTDIATDLSTRPVGASARAKLLGFLTQYSTVEIDFLEKSLTPSFADECIGQLAAEIGVEKFKQRIRLLNLQDSTKPLVRHVILTRCNPVPA